MSGRQLRSWVDGFLEHTKNISSPEIFRKWAAISTIAGALERKVWVDVGQGPLYPNLYVILCGTPGVGKTAVTLRVRRAWKKLNAHKVASASMTGASMIDELVKAERIIIRPTEVPTHVVFNSLLICSNEFGTLMPSYDPDIINRMTDIYNCEEYSETRRTIKEDVVIEKPQLNMIIACTPSYLNGLIPSGAWEQGFMSRMIIVFSSEAILTELFEEKEDNEELKKMLHEDLKIIGDLYGKFIFTVDARDLLKSWNRNGKKPLPFHPRLLHYNQRRLEYVLKLSMVASVIGSDELLVNKEHIEQSMAWLFEIEKLMPDTFKTMASGGNIDIIKDTWYHSYQIFIREGKKPVPEHRIYAFLQERTYAYNIPRILEAMEKSRMLEKVQVNKIGACYVPKPPRV